MAITKAAKRALKKSLKRRERNLKRKEILKKTKKEFLKLIETKKIEEAKKLLPRLYKLLDKAAKVNLIKKNTASRLKSRLTKKLNKASITNV
ncbi:MAG: 30S ribosomal protein S20 [Minisyncoccia bacterium]